jgi:hypothetical protein
MALSTGLAGVLVLGSAGLASAYWRTTGSGSGSAQASAALTFTAPPVTVAGLYPGGSQSVSFTVTASGGTAGQPVTVTGVTPGTVAVSGAADCPVSDVTLTVNSPLPAANTGPVVLDATVSMATGADNACQGRTFTIPLTVIGQQ